MVKPDLKQLAQKLKDAGKHITIETAGIAFIPQLPCDLMSISPKLDNSIPAEAEPAEIHKNLLPPASVLNDLMANYDYQLKFVVDEAGDIDQITQCLEKLAGVNQDNVFLMPQAANRAEYIAKAKELAEICKRTGLRLGQRLQTILWNNQRGK